MFIELSKPSNTWDKKLSEIKGNMYTIILKI